MRLLQAQRLVMLGHATPSDSGSRGSANSRPTSSTQVHANVDRDFDKYPFVGWLVDGKVVAMMALIEPETDFWTPEELAEPQTYISRFFVVEHGKGYGPHLLEAVTDQARSKVIAGSALAVGAPTRRCTRTTSLMALNTCAPVMSPAE
jgi:hypothetical protein